MMTKSDKNGVIALCFLFGFILLLIINLFFWFNDPCFEEGEQICAEFVSHGLVWWHCLIISLALIEITFIVLCYWKKKKPKEDIWEYVLWKKFLSLVTIPIPYLIILPLSWFVYNYIINILATIAIVLIGGGIVLGIVVIIGLYYLMNVKIAKWINRDNKKRKTKRRKTTRKRIMR